MGDPGFGGVDGHAEAWFGSQVGAEVIQGQVADDVVVVVLHAGAVGPDVVGAPTAPELIAAGGQLADQVMQIPVVGAWPAAVRKLATDMSAARSQSGKKRRAAASRNVKRAKLGGRVGSV